MMLASNASSCVIIISDDEEDTTNKHNHNNDKEEGHHDDHDEEETTNDCDAVHYTAREIEAKKQMILSEVLTAEELVEIEKIGAETALDLEVVRRLSTEKYHQARYVQNNISAGAAAYMAGAEKALNAYCNAMLTKKASMLKLKKKKVEVSTFLEKKLLQKRRTNTLCLFGADEGNKIKFELTVACAMKEVARRKRHAKAQAEAEAAAFGGQAKAQDEAEVEAKAKAQDEAEVEAKAKAKVEAKAKA